MIWDKYKEEIGQIHTTSEFQSRLLETADKEQNKKKQKGKYLLRYASIGIVLCMCVICVWGLLLQAKDSKIIEKELPMITFGGLSVGGMGIPAVQMPDSSYFENENPWYKEAGITKLPVFKNKTVTDRHKMEILEGGMSEQEQRTIIDSYQKSFQFGVVKDELISEQMISVTYELGSIRVEQNGTVGIFVNENHPLTHALSKHVATQKEAEEEAIVLVDTLKDVLELKKPQIEVTTEFFITGEQIWKYYVFEDKDTLEEDIISYNFNKIWMAKGQGNDLVIWINNYPIADEVGEYPILSAEEAKEAFYQGEYISLCPKPLENEEIAFLELMYYYSSSNEYVIPMYLIYAPFKDTKIIATDGLITYGMYYVPAISQQYLEVKSVDNNYLTFN